jgi:hypothetical protein
VWLTYVFVSSLFIVFGVGVLMVLALPLVHLVIAVDAYRQVAHWRGRERPRVG